LQNISVTNRAYGQILGTHSSETGLSLELNFSLPQ